MAELLTQEGARSVEQGPVEGLIAFLREHPYRLDHSREELAARFGLDEEFVGDVLDTLRGSPNRLRASESFVRAMETTWRTTLSYLSRLYDDLTERPVVSLFVTLVLTVSLMLLIRHAGAIGMLPVPEARVPEALQNAGIILGATLAILHGLVYFRHGMMRYAIYGSGIVMAVAVATLVYLGAGQQLRVSNDITDAGATYPLLVIAGVLTAMFYLVFATVVSLAAGYWHTSQADKLQRRLTRQELIDRLFQLQETIRSTAFDPRSRGRLSLVSYLRVTPWIPIIGLACGFVLGLSTVFLRSRFAFMVEDSSLPELPLWVENVTRIVTGLAFLVVGYLSAGVRRALVALTLMFAGTLLAESLPFPYYGPAYVEALRDYGKIFDGLVNTLVFALFIGMGGHIERRARVRQKLQENDPAHLTAEIVEIQWRLNPTAGSACTMVVDVAGSTRMKAEADPLAVEYSFRAYHQFVAEIAQRRGGTVLSEVGDGAVFAFLSCGEALYAAKEIQTRIGEFNARVNRLASPFRVRIGIHTGQATSQLREVPFNELIDIAAHVEKEAPVGGIAMTQSVVEDLEDERVAALKEQVDGHNVFVVINPTLME
jgi:class 3 adenylate cyclase